MKYEVTEKLLGSWAPIMRNFTESKEFDSIFTFLKSCTQAGKEVYPVNTDLFRSLQLTDRNKLKVVIITGGPYTNKLQGNVVASGIPYDCSKVLYEQPPLYCWYQALENEYGFDPDNDIRRDLSYLLQQEHVLLIGSSLTTEASKYDSHSTLWEPFWKYMIENVINTLYRGLPIVLIGSSAAKLEKYITPMLHHVLKVEDPTVAIQHNRAWKSEHMFQFINRILAANNSTGYQNEVQWTRAKGETTVDRQVQKRDSKELPSAQSLGLPWVE